MELRWLKTFLAVARLLNFTQAAQELNLAQSSVSAQIRDLEDHLGVKLFDRLGRTVKLTEAGMRLKEHARRMLEMTEAVRCEVAGGHGGQGSLTIRVPETLAVHFLPEIVARFHAEHPNVQLNLINCDDMTLPEELRSGRIDLAFLLTAIVKRHDVTVEFLRTEPLALALPPSHPFAELDSISPSDLHGQTVLMCRTD
mgnify:CR=1 FL=1